MTTRDDFERTSIEFDRLITAWFDAEAHVREPDDLFDRTIALSERVRPRPAWLLPERWLPMDLALRPVRAPRIAPYLVVLSLLAIVALVAALMVGSQRRVPPPFGPAANGSLAYVTDTKDIATVDPVTGKTRIVVGGETDDRYPVFSRDGTRIAFIRSVDGGEAVFAADASGGDVTRLTSEPLKSSGGYAGLLKWSPDGSRVALHSSGALWIAQADGSGATRLELGMPFSDELEWRPPNGDELLFRGTRDGKAGLFLVKPDGSDLRAVTPLDGGQFDYLWVSWSPDGQRLAYHIEQRHEIELLTIGDSKPTVLKPIDGRGLMFPRFSPDGTRLAAMAWHQDGSVQVGVLPADDPTPEVTLTGPVLHSGIQFDWSPDGTEILAIGFGSDEPWILDPAGGPGQRTPWSISVPDWVEWQRLAR